MSPLGRLASGALIFAVFIPVNWTDAASLKEATVTQAYNVVKVVAPSREDRSAAAGDRITGDQGVRTGQASRAELEFIDRTLTRLGANTIFTFENGTREMQLEQGTMLLQVPKAAGGAKIRTAAITAAITGTTILLEYSPDFNPPPGSSKPKRKGHVKVIVLEGTLRLYLNKRMGESVLVRAGQMLITTPDAQQLPESVDVDISKLVDTSLLVNNRYWQNGASSAGSNANPQGGNLSMPLIDREIARQRALLANGTLVETNLGITGRGTIVMIQSNDPQSQINTRTTVAQSQVTAPVGVPTNPGSFTVDAGTTIKTNPPMQTGSTRATGAVYLGRNIDGPFSMFGLGPARPFDATAGFAGSFFGNGNFPSLGVAVFRYGGTLTLAGSVNFDVTGGRTSVALIANNGITTSTNEFVFNLAGLTELLLATANGPLTIGSAASISGTDTRLDLYARGAASDLTIDGFLTLGNGALFAAAERDIFLNGTINSASLSLVSGGSINFNDRIFTGPVTARAGLDIAVQAEGFLQASGAINFTAGRNLMINGQLSAPAVSLTAANLLTFGGNNLDFEQLTSLTAAGGSIRLTSDLTLGNGATATLTAANGIDGTGFDLSGTNLTLTLTGGTLAARTISAQTITASNATIDAFVTAGTFNVNAGTVSLTGGGTGSGNFNIASGATLDFAGGTQTLSAPGSVSGAGNVRFSGGSTTLGGTYNVAGLTTINGGAANFDGSAAAASVALSAGTLGGAGIFHATGPFAWTGGTMAGPGTTIADGLFTISGAAGETISGGRVLIADAVTNFSGGNLNFISSSAPAGGFTNNGSFNALDDADIVLTGTGSTPIFANATGATFVKSGTGTTTDIGIAFTNAGAVNVTGGTLSFSNTYTQTVGTLALLGGNVQTTGTLALQGGLLTGAGSVFGNVLSGANIQPALAAGGLNVSGNLSLLSASQLSFQIGGLVAGTQYSVLNVGGAVALNGTLLVSFANGFQNSVANGNTFTLMTTSGFSGAFANIISGSRLLTTDGFGSFLVTYSGTTLTLSNFISGSANFATWLGGTGNWSDATRWSTNPLFPNNGNGGFVFVASLGSGSITQDVAGGVIIEQLQMSGGTLILSNPLRLNSGLQFSGGTIRNGTLNLAGASSQSALMTTAALTINNAGTYDLAFDSSNVFSGGALFINTGTLIKSTGSGTLTFNNQLNNTGTVSVLNGTLLLTAGGLNAGTYNAAAGATLEFASSNAFNSGSVFSGAGVVQFDNNTDTTFNGTVNNSGRILINAGGNSTRLIIGGNVTLTGGGTLIFNGVNAQLTGGFQLTNLNNQIQGFGNLGANLTSFLNQAGGVINANVNAQSLLVDPGAGGFVNQGLLEATNGGFLTLTGNGGGAFNNTGGTILANGAGSEVQLFSNVVVTGGMLQTLNSGVIRAVSGQSVFLNGLTIAGNYIDDNNADTHITGTINNLGSLSLNSVGNLTRLILDSNATLTGGGTVNLVGVNAQITGGATLTNFDNVIQGQGNIGANLTAIVNQSAGVINANVSGQVLYVDPVNSPTGFVNNGLLEATNGGFLQLTNNGGGSFVNNATILADGAGSQVQLLQNVDITGGTLSATNGGIIRALTGQSVFLHNLTLNGPYVNDNNADTHLTGTITNLGSISLNSVANLTRLILDANLTLTGGGIVNLNGPNAQITGGFTLTNVNNIIQGQGNLGANVTMILNQAGGVIDANVNGQILYVDPINNLNGFVNHGVFEATSGGLLQLTGNGGGAFVNTGSTILASGAGSEVQLLQSVDITGGTLSATGGGIIHALTGQSIFLHSLTLNGPYVNDNNADTHFTGTITNLGSISLNSVGNITRLILDADVTLTGGGTVNLNGANAQITGGFQLTNVNNVIQGQGNLGANVTTILNQSGGTIDANVPGQILYVDPINNPNGFVNHGVFEATNGGLLQLTGNGGGAFVNTGSTILATGSGSQIQLLQNVDITGGTLSATSGGIVHALTGQSVFLHNLTLNGPYVNDNNADTHITGTINNLGSLSLNSVGNITRLILDADSTLTGGGTVNLSGANAQITGGFLLTNVDNLIQGQGNLGANVTMILNQAGGVINANVTGQALFVDPVNSPTGFVNNGLVEATNGGLLQLSGNGNGAFQNNTTISADGIGSEVQLLQSVIITGGTLSATNGGVIRNLTGQTAFLSGLTLVGPYVNDNNADTHITGTIANTGSMSFNSAGNLTRLILEANSTLTGGGTVNLNGVNAQITGAFQLTNVDNLIQGQGNLGANVGSFVNQAAGIFNANVSGQTMVIDPVNSPTGFVNNGLLEATNGGVLQLTGNGGGAFVNSGTIQSLSGGVLRFDGTVTSSGTVNVGSGTLTGTGNYTQTAGTFQVAGGTVQSNNALVFQGGLLSGFGSITANIANSATIRPDLGGTGLAVTGNISLLSGSQLNFQLGGLTQGSQFGFISVNGAVTLGGNLVLSFANGFQNSVTGSNTFTLITTIGALSGVFANIASGSRLNTSDGFGSFLVTYGGGTLTLSGFISNGPLPGTWIGTTGNWSTAGNWSAATVPNDPALDVFIDGGRTGTNSNVTLDISVNVRNLTIDTGDRLTILNGAQLTLSGTTLTNNGQITINAGGGKLTLPTGSLITGTGTLVLVGGTSQMGSAGTITQDVGHTLQGSGVVNGAFVNNGLVLATGGTLNFSGGFTQNAGLLNLTSGTVSSPSILQINGGSVTGVGTIAGSVNNNGVMQPLFGSGGLGITGALNLGSSSSLIFSLGGTILGSQYGLINVGGAASLDGQINALFSGGFQASVTNANVFTILNAGSPLTGLFANVASGSRLTTGDGFGSFLVTYSGAQVILSDYLATITNFVGTNWLSASSGAWTTATNWSSNPFAPNDATPSNGTGYNVTINAAGTPYTITLASGIIIQSLFLNSASATLSLNVNANLRLIGDVNLQAGTLAFNGGTLRGATLNLAGGSLTFTNSGNNIFDHVMVNGNFTIATSGGIARLDNGSQISGNVTLSGSGSTLAINQDATMMELTVNMGSAGVNTFVSVEGNHIVTLDNSVFLHGVGNVGQARILGGTGTLINRGTISADVSGQTLTINPNNFTNQGTVEAINGGTLTLTGNVTNTGTISADSSTLNLNGTFTGGSAGVVNATNSTVNLGGSFTTAGLSQVTLSGGTLNLSGTLNNAGSTFSLTPNLGVLTLAGGTISGGTVSNAGGDALAFNNSGSNVLSNVAVNGGFTIANNGAVRLDNGSQITGTVILSGTGTLLALNQDATMTGLTVNMGSAGVNAFVSVEGNHTVTLDNTVFLHGVGNVGQARIFGGTNTLINQGIISADVSGQTLNINPTNFTNQGTLNAINGAILTLTGNVTNSGTIMANASTLNLNGTFTGGSAGVVNATNSTVTLGGSFTTAGLGQITRSGGTLTLTGTLNNAGSTFSLAPNLGVLTLNGGTISGGTVSNASGQALAFSNSGSNVLSNVAVSGGLIIANNGGTVRLDNSSQIAGTVTLSGTGAFLAFNQDATVTGLTVNLGSAGVNAFVSVEGNHTITLDNTVFLHGVGNIGQARIFGGNNTLINQGIISADVSGQTLTINPTNFTNQGTLNAINGSILTLTGNVTNNGTIVANGSTLNLNGTFAGGASGVVNATNASVNLGGTFTTAGLNQMTRSGGTLTLTGTLNNAGSTFSLTPNLGVLTLNGGTISGGTVDNSGGQALAFSNSGSNVLSNVAVSRGLIIANNGGTVRLDNGSQITGTAILSGTGAFLAFNQDATVTGLTVNLGSAGVNAFVSVEGNHTVTLDSTVFLHGVGNIGQARIFGGTNTLINQGIISADVSGQTLNINPTNFTNQGTLNAINGAILTLTGNVTNSGTIMANASTLNLNGTFTGGSAGVVNATNSTVTLGGSFTTAGLGQITRSGGTLTLTGTLNNAGSTFSLTPALGVLTLNGGTISGGTVDNSGGQALAFSNSGSNVLSNAAVSGGLIIANNGGTVRLDNGSQITGAVILSGTGALLAFNEDATVTGLTVNLGSAGVNAFVSVEGNHTVTLDNTVFLHGVGNIGQARIFGGTNSLINQGIISADVSGQTLTINPSNFTNQGTLNATNGATLTMAGPWSNSGTIQNVGSATLRFNGTGTSSGTVNVGSGSLVVGGTYTQTAGTFQLAGGTVSSSSALNFQGGLLTGNGSITAAIMNNAMLQPALGGTGLAVTGNVSLLSGSQLGFQLGGLTQGSQYGFLSVNGAVTLGGNLVLSFANGFQATVNGANTFTLMSGSSAFAGAFANIASGSRLNTSDGFGSFLVTYSGSTLVLSAYVPAGGRPARLAETRARASLPIPSSSQPPRSREQRVNSRAALVIQNTGQLRALLDNAVPGRDGRIAIAARRAGAQRTGRGQSPLDQQVGGAGHPQNGRSEGLANGLARPAAGQVSGGSAGGAAVTGETARSLVR